MKPDCYKYDYCDAKNESSCCGAKIILTDICSDCKEHTSDCCEDCEDYRNVWDEMQKKNDVIYKDLI
jgi:hypothetical protein